MAEDQGLRPDQLLSAKHDHPDQTGELIDAEPGVPCDRTIPLPAVLPLWQVYAAELAARGADSQGWNAAAAAIPGEWVEAAEAHYSMHGAGLIRNILAGAEPLIRADERERIAAPASESTGDHAGPYFVREFTSASGAYSIRYVPRYGLLILTDKDYGPAASKVHEWLCLECRTLHPWQEGDRISRPCPRCARSMIPTSPSVRALEDARAEIEGLKEALEHVRIALNDAGPYFRAEERERIAKLAEEHEAAYPTCPCRPGSGDPAHADGSPAPFADLIRGET